MIFIIIFLGLLPGFAWLLFYLEEDTHPEPKRIVAMVFLAGVLSAVAALVAEFFVSCAFVYGFGNCAKKVGGGVNLTPVLILVFAVIEEVVKFGAVYLTVAKTKYFKEPIDAMVYMAVAALGFATVENLGALSDPGTPVLLNSIFEIATFRFVGTTLLHTLTASITGYFWALGIRNFKNKSFLIYGLILASALHAAFNYLILTSGNLFYPIVFVAVVGFFTLGDFDRLKDKKL